MKRNMILFLLFAVFMGCEKIGDLKISDAIKGGCFLDESGKGESLKNSWPEDKDTVTYQITGDNLEIFLGFNATCCGDFTSNSNIKGDSIIIDVETTQIGNCNCICYYTYNFKFAGNGKNYNYKITVDGDFTVYGNLVFTGKIRL